jgi:hypothetical protein
MIERARTSARQSRNVLVVRTDCPLAFGGVVAIVWFFSWEKYEREWCLMPPKNLCSLLVFNLLRLSTDGGELFTSLTFLNQRALSQSFTWSHFYAICALCRIMVQLRYFGCSDGRNSPRGWRACEWEQRVRSNLTSLDIIIMVGRMVLGATFQPNLWRS